MKNPFLRAVLVLFSGTAAAQAIGYLVAPILTRLYNAEEMGELAIYMRAVGFIAGVATLRYELSLPIPKRDEHSFLLYRLSLRIALGLIVAGGLGFVVFAISGRLSLDDRFFYSLVLLSAIFLVLTNLGTYWAIRKNTYRIISRSKVASSFVTNGLRWLFGVWGWSVKGLLLASLVGYVVGSIEFLRQYLTLNKTHKTTRSKKKTKALSIIHKDFPTINLPHVMVDLGRELLLALIISVLFSKEIFGWYSYSYTMLRLPVALLGASIGQVLMSRCASQVNEKKPVTPLVQRALLALLGIAVIPFTLIAFFGEPVFAFVFGADWATSGVYAEIMAPWLMLSFVTSSLSTIPVVLKQQRPFFLISTFGAVLLIFTSGFLPFAVDSLRDDFNSVLRITTLVQTAFAAITLLVYMRFAKGYDH